MNIDIRDFPVDYIVLASFVAEYAKQGFVMTDVPWIVDEASFAATTPGPADTFAHRVFRPDGTSGVLVGSAEQGFLHLLSKDRLPCGALMAASPCFRVDRPDRTHLANFMKLELFQVDISDPAAANDLAATVADACRKLYGVAPLTVPTGGGDIDLEMGGCRNRFLWHTQVLRQELPLRDRSRPAKIPDGPCFGRPGRVTCPHGRPVSFQAGMVRRPIRNRFRKTR